MSLEPWPTWPNMVYRPWWSFSKNQILAESLQANARIQEQENFGGRGWKGKYGGGGGYGWWWVVTSIS